MQKTLTKHQKLVTLLYLTLSTLTILLATNLTKSFFKAMHSQRCIYDIWRWPILPALSAFINHPLLNKTVIALDSLMIDSLALIYVYFYVIKGKSALVYVLLIFYGTRSLALTYAGQWPKAVPFTFTSPGVPSIFVDYRPTNDYYFSGHIGMTTFIYILSVEYQKTRLAVFACVAICYTWIMLAITGAHYINDMIVGLVMAVNSCLVTFKWQHSWTYWALRGYCGLVQRVGYRGGWSKTETVSGLFNLF